MDNIAELTKESPTLKSKYDAATKGKVEGGNQPEYKEGDEGREGAKAGSRNRPVTSSITEEQAPKEKVTELESLASQIAAEVKGMQPQQEQTYSEKAKRYSDKLRRLAEKSKIKFYDENGDEINLNTMGFTESDLLNLVAAAVDKLGSIADDVVRLKTAIKQVLDGAQFNNFSDKTKEAMSKQLFDMAEANKERGVRQSRIIQAMIKGGSLSNEKIAMLMPVGIAEGAMKVPNEDSDSKIKWIQESVSIEETQEIIDELLDTYGYDKMMDVANAANIAPWFRVLLAGRINDEFYLDEQQADNEFDKQLARDKSYSMIGVIEGIGKDAGRTLRFIREVYKQSPIAYAKYQKNNIDIGEFGVDVHEENELIADAIADLFNGKENQDTTPKQQAENRKQEAQESMVEAADQVFEDEPKTKEDVIADLESQVAGIDEDIAAIEAQIAAEREARKNAKKPGTGGVGGVIKSSVRNVMGMNEPSDLQKKLNELKAKKKELQAKIKSMKEPAKAEKKKDTIASKTIQGRIKEALIAAGYTKKRGGKDIVDWSGIIGDSATQEEAKQAIYDKVKEVAGEDAANELRTRIDAVYNQMVAKKKVDEINKILAAKNRPAIKRPIPASAIYNINRLINLNGGVIGANIQSTIGNLIGTTNITPEQSARITQLSQSYFDAQAGFERRQALERMTNYINFISKGKAWYAIASINQHYVNGLISGLLTSVKNFTVIGDLVGNLLTDYVRNGFDSNVIKLAAQSLKEGGAIFSTVVGQGYSGRTLSALDIEMQGKEKVNPRLAEFAYDITPGMKGETLSNALRNIWDAAKYTSRLNEGVDSIFGSVSANVAKYNIMKDIYRKQGMSSNQAAQAAYQALYVTPQILEDAMDEARAEYAKRGETPTESRVKRRAYEIIDKNRIDQVDKDGTEVKKMAEEAANQLTYKTPGLKGVTHLLAMAVNKANETINEYADSKYENKKINKRAAIIGESLKLFISNIAPFANVGANVTETSLDWLPIYGTGKYLIGKNSLRKIIANDKTGENTVRLKVALRTVAAKQAISITLAGIVAAAFLAGDDDDDEELMKQFDIVKGTGGKYVRKNVIPSKEKGRSLGDIPLDFMGSFQTALLLLADYKDEIKANPDTDDKDVLDRMYDNLVAVKDAYFTAVLSQSVMRGIAEVADAVSNFDSTSKGKYWSKKSAELAVNSSLPALGMAKQIGDITSPVKKESIDYVDYLKNASGAYATWAVDKPKFDWRGRKYATGDLYASNLRSILGLEPILKADEIDEWALDKGIKTTTPKTEYDVAELDNDRKKFTFITESGKPKQLDEFETYDFRKLASDIFNIKMMREWNSPSGKEGLMEEDKEGAQAYVNKIWNDSKSEALYRLNIEKFPSVKSEYSNLERYEKRFEGKEEKETQLERRRNRNYKKQKGKLTPINY
jgi:hypothetical protein